MWQNRLLKLSVIQRQNLAARKLLSPEVANDKTLYPDAETIKNGEWQNDVGSASSIYEEYYQKLKAGR